LTNSSSERSGFGETYPCGQKNQNPTMKKGKQRQESHRDETDPEEKMLG